MHSRLYVGIVFGTTLMCYIITVMAENGSSVGRLPLTRFSCKGRPSGYYADVDTGCQVYHMCDGLGRQFSYTCPNTTLFQQRMLICDHWYMVNCSQSEKDYDANLLIGQRDKPFVSEADMHLRTPRPDILSVPPNNNFFDGLKEAESKYPVHPGNSIVGIADSINFNNGLDSAKQNYRPPTGWSTGTGKQNKPNNPEKEDNVAGAASQEPRPTFQTTPAKDFSQKPANPTIPTPASDLSPPLPPITTTTEASEDYELDIRMGKTNDDAVVKFIKRFDPNSPDSIKTSMTQREIITINQQLPDPQISAEEERTSRKNKNFGNNFNTVQDNSKNTFEGSRFDTANLKPTPAVPANKNVNTNSNQIPTPSKDLLPPKKDYTKESSTTMGPPIYYEWKWAVPAFDLEPPNQGNLTNSSRALPRTHPQTRNAARSPFSDVTRLPIPDFEPTAPSKNTEYNISSYLVPDYVFPLEKSHVGYEKEDAQTSFQVKVSRPGRASYGENPNCPHCHPAYLNPGSCEPCIVKR